MGEVTPGPPLLQAGLLSSAPGEAACSLLGALTAGTCKGPGVVGTPALLEETFAPPKVLELEACCSALPRLLESFASAGTGMVGLSLVGSSC